MPLTLRASLDAVLLAVKAQVAAATGLAADRVLPVARPSARVPKLVGDQDILIRFRGFRADPKHRDRHDCRLLHRLEVTVRTRFEMDSEDKDTRWLTDPIKGNVYAWQAVLDGLQGFVPTDPQGNVLTVEPLAVIDGDDGERDAAKGSEWYRRRGAEPPGTDFWGEAVLNFGALMEAPLTQRQAGSVGFLGDVL